MPMDEKTLLMLAAYCRKDPEDEVEMEELAGFAAAAAGYLLGAGVPRPAEGDFRRGIYDLVLKAMVLDLTDKRGATAESVAAENPIVGQMLTQLQHTR